MDDSQFAKLKDLLEAGVSAITSGDDWERYLRFQARFPRYSFGNVMLALAQRPDATLLMPEGRRKDGRHVGWYALGRTLVPGAQRIMIWKPVTRKQTEEQKAAGQGAYTKFWPVPVYDVADTEGDPLPDPAPVSLLTGDDAAGLLGVACDFIRSLGFTVEFAGDVLGGANGDMNPVSKLVRIVTEGRDPRQQAKTALHEAAHAVLHAAGKGTGKNGGVSLPRSQKEVEAESVAFIVSMHLGVDTGEYSFGYVAGWAADTGMTPKTVIGHSGRRIQSAASKIIRYIAGDAQAAGDDEAELEAAA